MIEDLDDLVEMADIPKLTPSECKLLLEMKDRCLNSETHLYKDKNAQKKYELLCHLEDYVGVHENMYESLKNILENME